MSTPALLRRVRDALVAYYAAEATPATRMPERRLVMAGTPAWDCAQLYVTVLRIAPTDGSPHRQTNDPLVSTVITTRAVVMGVGVVRPVSEGVASTATYTPPTPTELEHELEVASFDIEAIRAGLINAWENDHFGESATLIVGPMNIIGPMGGFMAVDYEITLGSVEL